VQATCCITVQLLLAGLQDIDVNDWKRHTKYRGEYNPNHPVIVNFWKVKIYLSISLWHKSNTSFVFIFALFHLWEPVEGSVHEPDKLTYLVLSPTTEMCSTLRILSVYAKIFVLNSEKKW